MTEKDGVKKKLDRIDRVLDKRLDDVSSTALKSRAKARIYGKKAMEQTSRAVTIGDATRRRLDETGDDLARKLKSAAPFENIKEMITKKPLLLLTILFIVCGLVIASGVPRMLDRVDGNMEVYLPEKDPAAEVVHEVRHEEGSWSVDVLILYVESPNALDPDNIMGITHVDVLNEMARIEEMINPERGDEGRNDSVRFVLSISVMIQEANSTPSNFKDAVEEVYPGAGFITDLRDMEGEYAIPDQETVNEIVDYIPTDFKEMLMVDSNGDGVYDTAGIYIGLEKDKDHAEFYEEVNMILAEPRNHTQISITGPVAITRSLTERAYSETVKVVPLALILVFSSLLFFHRNPKILLICGIPIGLSVGTAFGFLGLINVVITPQVIIIAPILIALGVAYGLYLANRYSEETDIPDPQERMVYTIEKTHKPILLSAITTSIGFASLMTSNLVPIRVIGLGLAMGILFSYVITMIVVPSLIVFLKYEKASKFTMWKKVGGIPIEHRKKIVIYAVVVLIISLALIPSLEANLDVFEMAPSDDPTVEKMREFGEKFGGGQVGMAVIYGSPRSDAPWDGSMEDVRVLTNIETLQEQARKVENTRCITVVDVMKTVRIPQDLTLPGEILPIPMNVSIDANTSFWDVVTSHPLIIRDPMTQKNFIRIFYATLSPEMRYLLVNKDHSKTLIFVDMPTMDAVDTKTAVDGINSVLENHGADIRKASILTGAAAIAVAVNDLVLFSSFQTLAIALFLVLVVLWVAFRSIKYAVITILPVTIIVGYQPLVFWLLGMDLNLLTAMVGSIIVGIGIDFGIHMTERIRERGETVRNITYAVETSGSSFFEATCTVLLGLFSAFVALIPSVNQFIYLIAILFVLCMLGAILVLPAIYAIKTLKE